MAKHATSITKVKESLIFEVNPSALPSFNGNSFALNKSFFEIDMDLNPKTFTLI